MYKSLRVKYTRLKNKLQSFVSSYSLQPTCSGDGNICKNPLSGKDFLSNLCVEKTIAIYLSSGNLFFGWIILSLILDFYEL